jgi:hypothetical protein
MSRSGLDISGNHLWNLAKNPNKAGVTRDKVERPNISGLGLWNPDKEPDKSEKSDMSGLGAGHVWVRSLEPE